MADRYWVGGTAAWDGTAGSKWALTSGGAGGEAVPTSADDVFFSAASTGTCTISTGNTGAKSINCTGFTGTLAGTAAISVAGSITLVAGMTFSYTGTITITATATVTSASKTFGSITINASGGTVTLADAMTLGFNTLTLTQGTFTAANFNVTTGIFSSSNSNTRTLNMGSGTWTLQMNTIAWDTATATGLTLNPSTSTISMTASLGKTFAGGGLTYYNLDQGGSGVMIISGNNTFNTLSSSVTTANSTVQFAAGSTQTVTNFNFTGTAPYSTFLQSDSTGNTFTLSKSSGTVNVTRCVIRDSVATGGATWNATDSVNSGNNTGWNITASTGRYWVGGTDSWDGTAGSKWATSSGGAGGATVPGVVDPVFLNAASGANTVTIASGNFGAQSINCTGFTGTLTGTAAITVSGSITLVAGMTYSYTGTITINATATITSASKTFGSITINASGGTVTLASALVTQATSTVGLTAGTLALNNFNLTTGAFASTNSNTRAISFGSGNILLSRTSGTMHLNMPNATNFTWTGTGAFVRNNAPATLDVRFGNSSGGTASNAPNLTVGTGGGLVDIFPASWFKNVNFTGFTGNAGTAGGAVNIAGSLTWATGGNFWSSGTTNFVGSGTFTSAGKTVGPITINGAGITVTLNGAVTCANTTTVTLTQGTLNLAGFTLSTGIFSSNNSNTRSIAFGAGNIALTSASGSGTSLDMGTATNFTLTGTGGFTRNQVATTTLRFGTIGGTASNAPNLTVTGSTGTLNIDGTASGSWFKNFILTGSSCSVPASSVNIAGNLSLGTNGSAYPGLSATFVASGTFTGNGNRAVGNLTINGSGITVTLATALNVSSVLTLTEGTFNAANFNVTTERFSSSNSNTRTLNMGSGLWIVNGSGAAPAVWNTLISTNLTLNPSTSTISLSSSSAKTFVGGGLTYYNLRLSGVGALTIQGSNTFNDITNTVQPSTVTFTAGTTQTVSNFSLAGTAGNLITINSATPGSQFTLSKASGTINAQYLSIQDSIATGGATWDALTSNGNVNAGNNTGWFFGAVAATGNMFLMFN